MSDSDVLRAILEAQRQIAEQIGGIARNLADHQTRLEKLEGEVDEVSGLTTVGKVLEADREKRNSRMFTVITTALGAAVGAITIAILTYFSSHVVFK